MPVKPDSRFADLPLLQVRVPDGTLRRVIALRLRRPMTNTIVTQHMVSQDEPIDLLAKRLYGGESLWWRILDANPVVFPLDIQSGTVLDLPAPGPVTRITRTRRF